MPLDSLPGQLVLPTRDQVVSWFLRDYALHNPGADTRPGSEPYAKALTYADSAIPLYANCATTAKNTSRATMTGQALINEATSMGTQLLPAVGAAGAVLLSGVSLGGTTIFAGDVLQIGPSFYQCTQTGTYLDQAQVPILGITTGPGTNQNPGVIGQWQITRPGCPQNVTVIAQTDGTGLSGGHDQESFDELRQRLDFLASNPPASGNDADIQQTGRSTPGLSIQQVFTVPCAQGPSTTAVTATLRASKAGGNRIPNATQLALLAAWLQSPGQLPADLGILVCALVAAPTTVVLRPTWSPGTTPWADATPWPPFQTPAINDPLVGNPAGGLSATLFRVSGSAPLGTPTVGQSVAVFDLANLKFRRKKILSFTVIGGGSYDITVDTTNSISDTSYTPIIGQRVCPWSDSLDTLTPAIVAYFDTLGPGEQYGSFVDPGSRQRRQPLYPLWPNQITSAILAGPQTAPFQAVGAPAPPPPPTLATLSTITNVTVAEPTLPYSTPVGSPGVAFNLITLGDLVAYP